MRHMRTIAASILFSAIFLPSAAAFAQSCQQCVISARQICPGRCNEHPADSAEYKECREKCMREVCLDSCHVSEWEKRSAKNPQSSTTHTLTPKEQEELDRKLEQSKKFNACISCRNTKFENCKEDCRNNPTKKCLIDCAEKKCPDVCE